MDDSSVYKNQYQGVGVNEKESIKVLREAIETQIKKSADYQNPASTVVQADFYPSGILTLHEIIHGKMLRIKSLMESNGSPNYESMEDSFIDIINYSSFCVAWLRGKVPGQRQDRDMFNKKILNINQEKGC